MVYGKLLYAGAKIARTAWRNRKAIGAAAAVPAAFMAGKKQYLGKRKRGGGGKGGSRKRSKSGPTFKKRATIEVHGGVNTFKKIQYKDSKLDKFASFIGGEFIHHTQGFVSINQDPTTTDTNSQVSQYLTTVYEQPDVLNIFNLAYQNVPLTAPVPASAPIVTNSSASYKFYMSGVRVVINGTNMSAGASNIKLYTIMSKNTKTSSAHPFLDWEEGQDDASGVPGQAAVTPNRVSASPTESKLFNMNYKIVDMKKFEVGPGGKINHTFVFNPRSVVDTEYWARNTYVRGFTMWIMAVAYGQVGKVDAANVTYANQPMIKPTDWVFNVNKHYRCKTVQHFPRQIYQFYALPGIKQNVVNPINIREDDGEIEV